MPSDLLIRRCRADDEEQVVALWKNHPVYRPEDQSEVDAMFERARMAEEAGAHWVPIPPRTPGTGLEKFVAFWVAQMWADGNGGPIIGIVGVYPVARERTLPPDVLEAREWLARDDVAVLEHLRVAPGAQRQGIGTRLVQTAIDWCPVRQYRTLILCTTAAQSPAICLYRKVGFREAFRSYVGKYELLWFEMDLKR